MKTALLLAGLSSEEPTTVIEAGLNEGPYGAHARTPAFPSISTAIPPPIAPSPCSRGIGKRDFIPGDFSSAAFWIVAAAVPAFLRIQARELGSTPPGRDC